jgi:ATP-binding protein involved in chromosome partitioning
MTAPPLAGVRKVVAVASGKGGVGKTTVAVNVALALRRDGARVGLFDADVWGPNVPLLLGVHRRRGGAALIPIARRDPRPYIEPLERFGLRLMSFGLVVGERDTVLADPALTGRMVTQTLRDVRWGDLDVLLLDLPPGSGEPQHSLLRGVPVDGALVVTTPQDLALLDAGRSLGMFRRAGVPVLGVVENMSFLVCPHCGERVPVFHGSERAWAIREEGVDVLGRVPLDVTLSRAVDAGHPLVQAGPDGGGEGRPDAAEGSRQAGAAAFREVARRLRERLASSHLR